MITSNGFSSEMSGKMWGRGSQCFFSSSTSSPTEL